MIRTQIQLSEAQLARLQRLASERRMSVAALIREAVDRHFADDDVVAKRERAIAAIGGFRSGRDDIAREHDRYLGEDFA